MARAMPRLPGRTTASRWRGTLRAHWRALVIGAGVLAVLLGAAFFAVAWYYSMALEDEALAVKHDPDKFELVASAVTPGSVTLEPAPGTDKDRDWDKPGTQGLQWEGGYGQVGPDIREEPGRAVRSFTLLEGALAPGTRVRLDSFAYPGDPLRAFALPFEDVAIPGPLGAMPAWFVDAPGDRWAILVHGHGGATRRDMLRQVPTFYAAGYKVLVMSYRNDVGAPQEKDGRYHFGATEWADLDAGVAYALEHGARGIVLSGNSMGGAIVVSFLERSPQAASVTGAVLDSPMLDFEQTVRWRARNRAPGFVVSAGLWVASWRFDLDYGELDYLAKADRLRAPVLLFQGAADKTVPKAASDELARLRPDLVTYVETAAEHVQSWNLDPAGFDARIKAFLRGLELPAE